MLAYGQDWDTDDPLKIELACIHNGGQWVDDNGKVCGAGLYHHHTRAQMCLWPDKNWHRWNKLIQAAISKHRIVGMMGPASSGKTHESASWALVDYYANPHNTTILCSSTTRDMLQLRIWGEIKKYHNKAKELYPWLPGFLTESKLMITTDGKDVEGREFRNGIIGVACKVGGTYVGLGNYVGVKNERVRLIADEAQFMSKAFYDAISNLDANPDFKLIAMGNPKDKTDALGIICEPHRDEGGWDGIPPTEKTKTWRTRIPGGICIQLVGTDSPNFEYPDGKEPYRFLIGRRKIRADQEYYGKDSLQYSMMDLGMMPKDAMARRVITRTLCEKFHAMETPSWGNGSIKRVFGLDAAYGNIGGDRCVGIQIDIGPDHAGRQIIAIQPPIIFGVSFKNTDIPEDQIAEAVRNECVARGIQPEDVFFDSTGRGTLSTAFARKWSAWVNPVEFGGRSTDRNIRAGDTKKCCDLYFKFVTELWFAARLAIEADQVRGLPEEVMMEGCMREFMVRKDQKIELEPKDITKLRMGKSPDLFDAFVVAIEGARRRGFQIAPIGKTRAVDSTKLRDLGAHFFKIISSKQINYVNN